MPELRERAVGPDDDGRRADVLLAGWLDEPRARAQERIAAGEVTVDGTVVVKSRRVRAGERLVVATPGAAAAANIPPPPPVAVRWEDRHLLVVAKPAGLVVHAGAGARGPTLVDALRGMGVPLGGAADPDRPGIVHRLDRGTSGLLVVAKSDEAYRGLAAAFRTHDVEREYWALCDGVPDPPVATVDAPIARSAANRTRFTVDAGGRRAVTHYDVLEAFGRAARLRVGLETGRTHQVRVHLAAVGHPVAGDLAYGASPALRAELGLERPALHAGRLAFAHPVTGERVAVEEPVPGDLAAALAVLRA
ncbi:MAG: RluA family pseudouridine synthase [Euzebyaceae bacterium]|nr:RluA family pseudouridine synthase [Euzebyaceae bacterium]